MKIEKGMYVRSKDGCIFKYFQTKNVEYDEKYNIYHEWDNSGEYDEFYTIIKASHNIIDLIEVGDYVNGIRIDSLSSNRFTGAKAVESNLLENDINRKCYFFENKDIKTILTKEQFENNCYKVEN